MQFTDFDGGILAKFAENIFLIACKATFKITQIINLEGPIAMVNMVNISMESVVHF